MKFIRTKNSKKRMKTEKGVSSLTDHAVTSPMNVIRNKLKKSLSDEDELAENNSNAF